MRHHSTCGPSISAVSRALLGLLAALLGSAVTTHTASAQGSVPPITLLTSAPATAASCSGVTPRRAASRPDTAAARRLASEGTDAALLGDAATARARLEAAVSQAPAMEDLEYQLGRLYEDQGDASAALEAYCRYLTLAPTAADSSEARRRLAGLSGSSSDASSEVTVRLRTGATYAERGEFLAAAAAFEAATVLAPSMAEAYHDQASVLVAAGQLEQGRVLLERYLQMRPAAPNAAEAQRQLRLLERTGYSPATALGAGILPAGGQFYTGQYILGAVIAAATAGGVVYALDTEQEIRTVTGVDPNGVPYQYEAAFTERPNLLTGLGIAAGATIFGAIEAWWWADRGQSAARQLSRETASALRGSSGRSSSAPRLSPFSGPRGSGIALKVSW